MKAGSAQRSRLAKVPAKEGGVRDECHVVLLEDMTLLQCEVEVLDSGGEERRGCKCGNRVQRPKGGGLEIWIRYQYEPNAKVKNDKMSTGHVDVADT